MRRFLLSTLALMALATSFAGPARSAERPRLLGLKRMAVAVTADPEGDLDRQKLRLAIEEKIRDAGIRVDPKSRSRLDVIIGIAAIKSGQGDDLGFAYSIHLSIKQPVYLAHNTNVMTDAVTWEGMWLGTASRAELALKCSQSIARRVDEFVDVYRAGLDDDGDTSSASARR